MITGMFFLTVGISGTFMNMVIDGIINPHQVQPVMIDGKKFFSEDIALGVPGLLRQISAIMFVFGAFTCIFCFKKAEKLQSNKNKTEIDINKDSLNLEITTHSNSQITSKLISNLPPLSQNEILWKAIKHRSFLIP